MCLCLGGCLGSVAASCLCGAVDTAGRFAAKYTYGLLYLISVILGWVFRDYTSSALDNLSALDRCGGQKCFGAEGVLRISFGSFMFFAMMFITTVGTRRTADCRDTWHSSFFSVKVLLWLFLLGIPFAISSDFFQVYGQIARVGSGIFLFIQLVSLLNFIYVWNDWWLESDNEDRCRIPMVLVSVGCYVLAFVGIVVQYVWFAPNVSCSLNIFFITFTIILILVISAISLHPSVNAGLMTSGIISLYLVFLCWGAIMSEPVGYHCNSRPRQTGRDWFTIISFFLAAFSIVVTVFTTGLDHHAFKLSSVDVDDPSDEEVPYNYGFFHFVFAVGCMYFGMLLLGWNLTQTQAKWGIDSGWFSVWVKMVSQWVAAGLYFWTMVAPFIFKDRDFS